MSNWKLRKSVGHLLETRERQNNAKENDRKYLIFELAQIGIAVAECVTKEQGIRSKHFAQLVKPYALPCGGRPVRQLSQSEVRIKASFRPHNVLLLELVFQELRL